MLNPFDNYFHQLPEPAKSCMQYLRGFILSIHPDIKENWQYGMPFFVIPVSKNKVQRICYLWTKRETGQPYLGVVDGKKVKDPAFIQEKRARMKILLLDPSKDLPINQIRKVIISLL